MHYAFHSQDNSAIFRAMFPEHTTLMTSSISFGLKYIDAVGMDTMFIHYQYGSIMDWLSKMLTLVTILDTSYSRFTLAFMWVPSPFLCSHLPLVIRSVLSELPQSWCYCAKEYNAAIFGCSVSDVRVCIYISVCTNVLYSKLANTVCPSTCLDCGFEKYVNASYGDGLVTPTVPFPLNTLSFLEEKPPHSYYLPLRMYATRIVDNSCQQSSIFYPEYPSFEPTVVGYSLPYGKWFGIPFYSTNGTCKIIVISLLELLLCYSIPYRYLHDETRWLG